LQPGVRQLRNPFYVRVNPRSGVSVGVHLPTSQNKSAGSEVLLMVKHGWGRAGSEIDRQARIDGRISSPVSVRRDYSTGWWQWRNEALSKNWPAGAASGFREVINVMFPQLDVQNG